MKTKINVEIKTNDIYCNVKCKFYGYDEIETSPMCFIFGELVENDNGIILRAENCIKSEIKD